MKKWVNLRIAMLVMWWCQRQLNSVRKEYSYYTAFEIEGTGKDHPKLLVFTDSERVKDKLKKIF